MFYVKKMFLAFSSLRIEIVYHQKVSLLTYYCVVKCLQNRYITIEKATEKDGVKRWGHQYVLYLMTPVTKRYFLHPLLFL